MPLLEQSVNDRRADKLFSTDTAAERSSSILGWVQWRVRKRSLPTAAHPPADVGLPPLLQRPPRKRWWW